MAAPLMYNNISYCNMQVNGVNILRLSARDAYAYGLQLLDILFTKEEQSRSLLFSSKKSPKPGLERERVDKLLGKSTLWYLLM